MRCLPRLPVATLMLAVALVALLCCEVRAFLEFSSDWIPNYLEYHVPSLLVGVNLLLLLGAVRLPKLWRTGRVSGSFAAGFQVAGWGSLFLFVASSLVSVENTHAYYGHFDPYLLPMALALEPVLSDFPDNIVTGQLVDIVFLAIGLGLPMLLVALFGGLIAWAGGIDVEVRLRRRVEAVETKRVES